MKAVVNKDVCIGCELCTSICPEVFSMDDDGLAIAIDDKLDEDLVEPAQEAEDSCPTEAITVE